MSRYSRIAIFVAIGIGLLQLQNRAYAQLSTTLNLNYVSETLSPGDTANIQGGGFTSATKIFLVAINSNGQAVSPVTPTVVSRSANLIQIQIPTNYPTGMWGINLKDAANNTSVNRYINQACGVRFNSDAVAPGGTVEVWGRNLGGYANAVSTLSFVSPNHTTYTTTATEADANHLTAVVPSGLTPGVNYQVYVSNGLGGSRGTTLINAPLTIRTAGPDNLQLGVPWAADFSFVPVNYLTAPNTYNVMTDARLALHAFGDGIHDDGAAIEAAIVKASLDPTGGGIVYLPAGTYLIGSSNQTGTSNNSPNFCVVMQSHVVVAGDGKGLTVINAGSPTNNGLGLITFSNCSVCGLSNLTINNLNAAPLGTKGNVTLYTNTNGQCYKIFLQNVDLEMGNGVGVTLLDINNLLITGSTFNSLSTNQNSLLFYGNSYMTLVGNTINYRVGRIVCEGCIYPLLRNNTFVRNGLYSYPGAYQSGGPELSQSVSAVVEGNDFIVTAGAQGGNNDGETILTQDDAPSQVFRDVGALTSASGLTVTDTSKQWTAMSPAPTGEIITITSGIGMGQLRNVTSITPNSVTIDRPWNFVPPAGSTYSLNWWTANQLFALNNTFTNSINRAIELYEGAWYCTISGNTVQTTATSYIFDHAGILLNAMDRTVLPTENWGNNVVRQNVSWENQVMGNTLINSANNKHMSLQLQVSQVNGPLHGNSMLNNEVRNNMFNWQVLNAQGFPVVDLQSGYLVGGVASPAPGNLLNSNAVLGVILGNNQSINITTPYQLGLGLQQVITY